MADFDQGPCLSSVKEVSYDPQGHSELFSQCCCSFLRNSDSLDRGRRAGANVRRRSDVWEGKGRDGPGGDLRVRTSGASVNAMDGWRCALSWGPLACKTAWRAPDGRIPAAIPAGGGLRFGWARMRVQPLPDGDSSRRCQR